MKLKFKIIFLFLPVIFLLFGCGNKKEIKFGATFPLSGDNALYGKHIKNGMQIAVEQMNSNNGIDGRLLNVTYLDDINDPKIAVNNTQQLINVYKVIGIVGSAGSNCTLAMAPIANSNKTVIISPTSSQAEISEAGPYVFRTVPSDVFQVKVLINWILELGYKRVGILYVTNSWGVAMKNAFENGFAEKGGQVVISEGDEERVSDFKSQLTKMKNANVDALFMPTYALQGGRAVKQAKELNIKLPMFGGDPWDVGEFLTAAGDASDGCMYTVFKQYRGKEYQNFAKIYKEKYKEEPDFLASSGYDALMVLIKGVEYMTNNNMEVNHENLNTAIEKMPVFIGATGDNTFDSNGDVINKIFEKRIYKNLHSTIY